MLLKSAITLLIPPALLCAQPPPPILPAPYATPIAAKHSSMVPWPPGGGPKAPQGFVVEMWASGLDNPRWLYQLPNGDVLVSEARSTRGQGRITLLRDTNGDGRQDTRFVFPTNSVSNLNQPFGMALVGSNFYVANTDGLWRFPYTSGATALDPASGTKILSLPADGYNNHWTRNVLATPDNRRLYVTVGSATNVDVEGIDALDPRRAAILEYTISSNTWRVFASGLRNPNGLGWQPISGKLWTAVNERDDLGDNLVPDFVTSVRAGGFYGWPYFYFRIYEDPRKAGERPDLVGKSIVPDLGVGSHTATLGLAFYTKTAFPERYWNGLFIAQHGSWNRAKFAGYRVASIPFDANGNVSGPPRTFLEGFIADEARAQVYGRPVCVIVLQDGSLLVSDDGSDRLWRVRFTGPDLKTPAIRGLMLFNAVTDQPIEPFEDGAVLDPVRMGTNKFSVAVGLGVAIRSVKFVLDGAILRIEGSKPWAIASDDGPDGPDDYFAWTPSPGPHVLEVTPYAGPNATGLAGNTVTVKFTAK